MAAISEAPFGSLNARFLGPHEVPKTFVPSQMYSDLLRRGHSLVLGPRGSGKTTLLMMATQSALRNWRSADSQAYRDRIEFLGVYVHSDITWAKQFRTLVSRGLTVAQADVFASASLLCHIQSAFVSTIEDFVENGSTCRHLKDVPRLDGLSMSNLIGDLAEVWDYDVQVRSAVVLRRVIAMRQVAIGRLARQEVLRNEAGRSERLAEHAMLHAPYNESLSVAIAAAKDHGLSVPFALLFDEMELVPREILAHFLSSFRSTVPSLFFKVTLAPVDDELGDLQGRLEAMAGHDFEYIPLTNKRKESHYDFSAKLFRSLMRGRSLPYKDPEWHLFGSFWDRMGPSADDNGGADPARSTVDRLKRLSRTDSSYRRFLIEHGIELTEPHRLGPEARKELQKHSPIAVVRTEFRAPDPSLNARTAAVARMDSRSTRKYIYTGATSLFALCEGNPRHLLWILSGIVDSEPEQVRYSRSAQARVIDRAIHRFMSVLKTVPTDVEPGLPSIRALRLLDQLGDYFFESSVLGPFTGDPVLSFVVDEKVESTIVQAVVQLVNSGALIYMPEDDDPPGLKSVVGARFRLSHLMGAGHRLPIKSGRPINLSTMLRRIDGSQVSLFERDD